MGWFISLYSGAGSGLKHRDQSWQYPLCPISLYSGAGSGLKRSIRGRGQKNDPHLPVLWCRERIETAFNSPDCHVHVHLPVLWCRERIETLKRILVRYSRRNLPVLWCRERIETTETGTTGPPKVDLPVLWCRERIETLDKVDEESIYQLSPCTLVQGAD